MSPSRALHPRARWLQHRCAATGMPVRQLWVEHLGLGGNLEEPGLVAAMAGRRPLSTYECAVLGHALHEVFQRLPFGAGPVPARLG